MFERQGNEGPCDATRRVKGKAVDPAKGARRHRVPERPSRANPSQGIAVAGDDHEIPRTLALQPSSACRAVRRTRDFEHAGSARKIGDTLRHAISPPTDLKRSAVWRPLPRPPTVKPDRFSPAPRARSGRSVRRRMKTRRARPGRFRVRATRAAGFLPGNAASARSPPVCQGTRRFPRR